MLTNDLPKDRTSLTITDRKIAKARGVSMATVRRWAALRLLPPKVGPGRGAPRNRAAVTRMLAGGIE
jgi:hypothetical protein